MHNSSIFIVNSTYVRPNRDKRASKCQYINKIPNYRREQSLKISNTGNEERAGFGEGGQEDARRCKDT